MLGFAIYKGCETIKYCTPPQEEILQKETRSSDDDILDLIFSVDPRTGYPTGAINQYESDKTNLQVREYIKQNILVDLPDTAFSTPSMQAREASRLLGDDFMIQCMKMRDESVEQYEQRVSDFLDHQKKIRDTERNLRELSSKKKDD